ncbi:MAG: glycosyltransferase family 4 protein [Candidatus Nitrospinota bacterium M3_3B_026]
MTSSLSGKTLTLFFSRGASLELWNRTGNLDREAAIYLRLIEKGMKVGFVTYGGQDELQYSRRMPGVKIMPNAWRLPLPVYERLIPALHAGWLRKTDVIKTNQTNGARAAMLAARVWRKPLIARCGYMWSEFAGKIHGEKSKEAAAALAVESKIFTAADRVVVTTGAMKDSVTRRVSAARDKTIVIPNYVDTELFKPDGAVKDEARLIFVGRLEKQKNVAALLEAVEPLDARLTIVGSGSLTNDLRERFGNLGGRVAWIGSAPHKKLPALLNEASIFVLPSFFEGHPKALIEAMACGLAVVGAESPGIRELIRDGENGLLCGTDPQSIRGSIQKLLENPSLRETVGRAAREYAVKNFSLDRIAEMEAGVLEELAGNR